MVVKSARKYWGCSLNSLKKVKGIGPKTIKNLKKAGYKDVYQVYSDSVSSWGDLVRVEGISAHTAKNLFREINKAKVCFSPDVPIRGRRRAR